MRIRKTLILCILLWLSNAGLCQYTLINGSYTEEHDGQKGRLHSVRIDRTTGRTYVTIEIMTTKKKKRLNILTGNNCHIKSGEWVSNSCYGEMHNDGSIHSIACGGYNSQDWGWDNVPSGETRKYTLVFDAIPPGLTSFSLVDKGISNNSCHGYGFNGYTIDNPRIGSTSWTEGSIKSHAETNNDGICGIYESSDETGYRIGCVKSGNDYQLIYLGSKKRMSWWAEGDAKAGLRASATAGVFKADWYMADKSINSDCYVFFDGSSMTTLIGSEKTFFLKMYPTSPANGMIGSGAQEWSGTGFALNNGYVVTNFHVVEDAKSIKICGVNGDFDITYTASVVATDKVNDLAIIKVNDNKFSGFGSLPYSIDMQQAEVGEDVFVLGYPLTQTMGEEIKLTNGIISSRTGFQGDVSLYQMSAPIQPGNSGGPLFNSKGNVVGIVCAHHEGAENVGYAIKTSYLKNLAESTSLSNIFPTNNTVSKLQLSGQVKKLKNYVFLILCSNQKTSPTGGNVTESTTGNDYDSSNRTKGESGFYDYILKNRIKQAYTRNQYALHVAHILVELNEDASPTDTIIAYKHIIELRKRVMAGEDFFEVARKEKISHTPNAKVRPDEGDIGYFTAFEMEYPFENAAYALQVGEVSMPVRSRLGYHIIKLIEKVPYYGKTSIQHIWINEQTPNAEAKIRRAYTQLKNGENFDVVVNISDDRGTSEKGGLLSDVTMRQLPTEYITRISYLAEGEYSEPFHTQYGWHIIKVVKKESIPSFEEMEQYYELLIKKQMQK